jgi:hypothetical protein
MLSVNVAWVEFHEYTIHDGVAICVGFADGRKKQWLHNLDLDIIERIIDGYYVGDT